MTQIDRETDMFLPCSCEMRPSSYSIGYGPTPYYMSCGCGKRMVDGLGGPESTFIESWNVCVRHMVPGEYKTHAGMLGCMKMQPEAVDAGSELEQYITEQFEEFGRAYKYNMLKDDGEYVYPSTNLAFIAFRNGFLACWEETCGTRK